MRILNVYKFATVGGVERVILNRAWAFKRYGAHVRQDVFFFNDYGGLWNFRKCIKHYQLEDHLSVVSELDEKNYDFIITFDTPEVFDLLENESKVIVECHSPYKESRNYLKSLPEDILKVVSPSEAFMNSVLQAEIQEAFRNKLFVLPNFHIDEGNEPVPPARIWGKKPLCYLGRMDSLKNTKELLEIFTKLREKRNDDFFLLLVGDVRPHYMDIRETIKKMNIEDRAAYYRPIPFENVDTLLTKIKQHEGIFVSPSRGESFGLSALEAMSNEVPVVLSDIECHKALVNNDPDFLYKAGDVREAVNKIELISSSYGKYDEMAEKVKSHSRGNSSIRFIETWNELFAGF